MYKQITKFTPLREKLNRLGTVLEKVKVEVEKDTILKLEKIRDLAIDQEQRRKHATN